MPFVDGTWQDNPLPNATDLMELAQYNNTITSDMFGLTLVLVSFLILYIGMSYTRSPVSLQASLFISTILSFLLMAVTLVGMWVPIVFLVAFIASIMLLYKGGDQSGV